MQQGREQGNTGIARLEQKDTELLVCPEEAGERLDRFLHMRLPGRSRTYLQGLISDGMVSIQPRGQKIAADLRVREGFRVRVIFPERADQALEPWDAPLPLLFEDSEILVVDKPAGVVVHPGAGHATQTLVQALLARYPEISSVGSATRPGVVHRLDKATSGALVIARTQAAYGNLVAQFAAHTIGKRYLAIVAGHPSPAEGLIDVPIGRARGDRKLFSTRPRSGKAARTHYRVKEHGKGFSLCEIRIETGRTHQIRVHLTSIGHPILGDTAYGKAARRLPPELAQLANARGGAFLHARKLLLRHPTRDTRLEITSPIPADFRLMWEALRARS